MSCPTSHKQRCIINLVMCQQAAQGSQKHELGPNELSTELHGPRLPAWKQVSVCLVQASDGLLHLQMQSLHLCFSGGIILLYMDRRADQGDEVMLAGDGKVPPAPKHTHHHTDFASEPGPALEAQLLAVAHVVDRQDIWSTQSMVSLHGSVQRMVCVD